MIIQTRGKEKRKNLNWIETKGNQLSNARSNSHTDTIWRYVLLANTVMTTFLWWWRGWLWRDCHSNVDDGFYWVDGSDNDDDIPVRKNTGQTLVMILYILLFAIILVCLSYFLFLYRNIQLDETHNEQTSTSMARTQHSCYKLYTSESGLVHLTDCYDTVAP